MSFTTNKCLTISLINKNCYKQCHADFMRITCKYDAKI